MLLHRYGNIEYVLSLPFDLGAEIINKANEAERDERLHRQWVAQLPYMGKENFVSFEEYRDNITGANIDTRTDAEIIAEVEEIERRMRKEGADGNI